MRGSEKKIRDAAFTRLSNWRTYIDIGAAGGDTANPFIDNFDNIICFEPNPNQARLIHPDITIYKCALADYTGTADLYMPEHSDNEEHASMAPERVKQWQNSRVIHSVQVHQLDSFKFVDVDFIKIDVEQGEMAVIKGAIETIKNSKPLIMWENKRRENVHVGELLKQMGYTIISHKTELLAQWQH